MAYGWPQVIPLEQGQCPSSQKVVYLKVINRLLLVVSPSHLELWSSSQVILCVHICVYFQYSLCVHVIIWGFFCVFILLRWVYLVIGNWVAVRKICMCSVQMGRVHFYLIEMGFVGFGYM